MAPPFVVKEALETELLAAEIFTAANRDIYSTIPLYGGAERDQRHSMFYSSCTKRGRPSPEI